MDFLRTHQARALRIREVRIMLTRIAAKQAQRTPAMEKSPKKKERTTGATAYPENFTQL
jgi:hypothetical protein